MLVLYLVAYRGMILLLMIGWVILLVMGMDLGILLVIEHS